MFTRPVFYIPLVPSAAYFEGQETTSSSLRELLSFRRNQSNLYLLHLHLSVHQLSSQAPLIFCRIYAGIFHAVTAIQLSVNRFLLFLDVYKRQLQNNRRILFKDSGITLIHCHPVHKIIRIFKPLYSCFFRVIFLPSCLLYTSCSSPLTRAPPACPPT